MPTMQIRVLALILTAHALAPATARGAEAPPPGVIAHRGVALEAPENTLPAITKAIELGCALAEIDLRYTADGEVVLMHDATLDRTTKGTGRVADHTLAMLRNFGVPTLREAVEHSRGRIGLYLDLKEADPLPVVRLIERLGARASVFYRPYSYRALRQILAEAPESRVLVDLGDWARAPGLAEMLQRDVPTGALSADWANWDAAAVAEARRRVVRTFANVLGADDTPENLAKAAALGFDYIQTDHPRTLLEILRARRP